MTGIDPAALGPLIALGTGAVLALVLAPFTEASRSRWAAGLGLAVAAALALARLGAPEGAASVLMADDDLTRFGVALVSLSALAALLFTRVEPRAPEAPCLIAVTAFGGAVLCGAVHGALLFMGLEVMSLSLVALFVFPLSAPALEAGYKTFIMSGAGAAALLLGMALLYATTGSLAFAGWTPGTGLFALGSALLVAGIGFKFSLVPFHSWTPDAFAGAQPSAATLAGVTSKVAVAVVLIRLAAEPLGDADGWRAALGLLGAASIIVGNLFALRQTSLARMLGYSTIAHSGYIAVVLAVPSALSLEAVLFYAASYTPALIAALCMLAALGRETYLEDLAGLIKRRPFEGAALVLALVSLTGLPPAVGFIGKLYVFAALADARAWGLLAVTAVGSGLGVYYYARFFTAPFLGSAPDDFVVERRNRILLLISAALIFALGVYPMPLIELSQRALSALG